jgi:hypothetical protein
MALNQYPGGTFNPTTYPQPSDLDSCGSTVKFTACNKTPAAPTAYSDAESSIDAKVGCLSDKMDRLRDKIHFLMRPALPVACQPANQNSAMPPLFPQSEGVLRLRQIVARLDLLDSRIDDYLDRLDV